MRAHGGIDAAARAVVFQDDIMQPLAHAMQALELKGALVRRHVQNGRHGVGIVGGKLRIDAIGHRQKLAGIGDVADIGGLFAGKDRETFQPQNLRPFHLGVPIGALHQPHHNLAIQPDRQRVKKVDHRACPAAIGLHHHAKAVPALQRGVRQHRLNHLERQRQTVRLFGVDVEPKARRLGQPGQSADAGDQLFHHAGALGDLIARMQRREFHRNAGVGANVAGGGRRRNRRDGLGIGKVIAPRIGFGARGLAQHVIAVGIAPRLQLARPLHRQINGFAQHEVAAHLLHRARDCGADHRLAQTFDGRLQMAGDARLTLIQHLAGQHQGPSRGVDKR